jgi:hypothetical protein
MVSKEKIFIGAFLILLILVFVVFFFYNSKEDSFSVKTFLLKSNVKVGESYEYKVNIKNNEKLEKRFNLSIGGNKEMFYLPEQNFVLGPNEEKEISVFFKDIKGEIKLYSAELILSDGRMEKKIPVVITLEDNKNLLSIIHSVISNYYNVYPGGKLGIDIKLYDLDDLGVPSVKAKLYIQNINGDILWSEEEDLIIDGAKAEIINIPKSWSKGTYIFVTSVEYKGVKSLSGYIFNLGNKDYNLFQNFNFYCFDICIRFYCFVFLSY